jgi:ribosomal protein S18 acetylase RimI-like enzyme
MTDLINLYRQAENYFFSGISSKYLNLSDSANAYIIGIPIADLNLVYIRKNPDALDKILLRSEQFFDQYKLSFVVIIPQKFCTPEIECIFKTFVYPRTGQSASMVVKLDELTLNNDACFSDEAIIRQNDSQLNDWIIPLIDAFESTLDMSSMYAAAHKIAMKKNINLHHFSVYKQEKPIASITLSLHNTIARIDDVGTLPEFQRKGYASALITYVLSEAKRLGARYCFLESSNSGLGVYQKLGFAPLFKNYIYARQA